MCDDIPDGYNGQTNADVICKTAGYPLGASSFHTASKPFGYGSSQVSFVLDDIACYGGEESIFDCGHSSINEHDCNKGEWFGVTCKTS